MGAAKTSRRNDQIPSDRKKIIRDLIEIEKSGKPLEIAIKDSVLRTEKVLMKISNLLNNIKSEEERQRIEKLIEAIKEKLEVEKYYYSDS